MSIEYSLKSGLMLRVSFYEFCARLRKGLNRKIHIRHFDSVSCAMKLGEVREAVLLQERKHDPHVFKTLAAHIEIKSLSMDPRHETAWLMIVLEYEDLVSAGIQFSRSHHTGNSGSDDDGVVGF